VRLLNALASKVEAFQLVGAFLQFGVKALDFKLFSTIIKQYLIPQSTEEELSIMYEMFDKDNNGVIDLHEFVKAFMVCDDKVLKLLNELVEQGLKYN
jgi:Ca2+-binding EF-hand superfamily protein